MSDFCKHHSIELFGRDFGELAHPEDAEKTNTWFYTELCESCGMVQVNKEGERVTPLEPEDLIYCGTTSFVSPLHLQERA